MVSPRAAVVTKTLLLTLAACWIFYLTYFNLHDMYKPKPVAYKKV